ncbi:MAG: 50S ribosomal protein L33 [bacterium]
MSKQDHLIKLTNKTSKEIIYTFKNKKQNPEKLEMKKYSKKLRKHVVFKEAKK